MGSVKTFYCQEIEKYFLSYLGRVVNFYQIGEQFGNAYKRATTGEVAALGCRATGLFLCDKNILRPQNFPLASEDTFAALVDHPTLVKTSDQPSFNTINFSPFTFLRLSEHQISALCQD